MGEARDEVPTEEFITVSHGAEDQGASLVEQTPSEPPSAGPSPYVPQFTSASVIILDRMKSGTRIFKDEDVDSPAQDLGATLPMPAPASSALHQTLPAIAHPTPASWSSVGAGTKRKRESSSEKVDFTQNTIPFALDDQPVSHPPSLQAQSLEQDVRTGQEPSARLKGRVSQQRQHEIEGLRQKRLITLPMGVIPAKPELVGFDAGRASDSSRVEYFESMNKTDLLNVLSLCDQLKPNLLVDVLVSVSKRHPDLPIFDSPDWEAQLPGAARRTYKVSRHDEKPRHGHVIVQSKVRPKQKTTKKILKRTRVIEVITSAPEEDQDVLPPTWAKAGEGMYSKLPPETEDRGLLVDDNDEEAFSHFLVDRFGKQIMEPVGA